MMEAPKSIELSSTVGGKGGVSSWKGGGRGDERGGEGKSTRMEERRGGIGTVP